MATRRYGISVGEEEFGGVTEGAGSAVASDSVEITIERATTAVNAASGTRAINKQEVLEALDKLRNHIIKDASGQFQ